MLLELITSVSIFLIVYHHLVYPLILKRYGNRLGRRLPAPDLLTDEQLPEITLFIPAHNEADYIAAKINNLGFIDYPSSKLKVIIACDGCRDNTAQLARSAATQPENNHLDIQVLEFTEQRGKVAMINQVIPEINSAWVAMSDVSALISIDGLRIAASYTQRHDVGVICSHYQLLNPGSEGEASYWRYQSQIKATEGLMGGTIGVHGACYIFRRQLFKPLPNDTINDDFVLPMGMLAQGYKGVYAKDLHALELESSTQQMDLCRRRRIAAGNIQQAWRLKTLALPRHKAVAFNFFSGKLLRVMMPYLMLQVLLASWWLGGGSLLWALIFYGQVGVYGLGGLAYLDKRWGLGASGQAIDSSILTRLRRAVNRLGGLVSYMIVGHLANLVGSMRYLLGLERGRWLRVAQSSELSKTKQALGKS